MTASKVPLEVGFREVKRWQNHPKPGFGGKGRLPQPSPLPKRNRDVPSYPGAPLRYTPGY
ncbi:hypothetical protein [Lunatibacter salilacus]|uniref:hypothetical protein n=1 Tax=Lunatibacter salilacus TaxID=2483804 RepID=UPI00131CD0A6|nr:hypothetical protein [Lunatibacter salilacus]